MLCSAHVVEMLDMIIDIKLACSYVVRLCMF